MDCFSYNITWITHLHDGFDTRWIHSSFYLTRLKSISSLTYLTNFTHFLGIRWHRWKWFRLLRSMLTFHGLSVCQSLTFVHFAQTAQNIHMIFCSMSLQDPVKIWLTSVYPFLPKFCPKVTHLVLIWASETFDSKLWPMVRWWEWS